MTHGIRTGHRKGIRSPRGHIPSIIIRETHHPGGEAIDTRSSLYLIDIHGWTVRVAVYVPSGRDVSYQMYVLVRILDA
jgi:hypothetical protein